MRFGTYYFFQRPPGASDSTVIRTEVDQIVWSEVLGFDSAWLTEHHFADYGISAAPSVLASAVLSRTERLQVGLAVYVLPFHDPLRIAEETATLDILGDGRLTVGLGRGNRAAEFVGYRVPQDESRERFEEAAEILVRAWTEDVVAYQGRHFRIPPLELHPKPLTRPHPPIGVAVGSAETIAWTARHGYRMLCSGLGTPLPRLLEQREQYHAGLVEAGHDAATIQRLLGQWTVTKHVYVAPTDEEAWADARPAEEWYLDAFARSMRYEDLPGLSPAIVEQAAQAVARIRALRWEELIQETLLIGSPATVRARVQRLQDAGVGELVCWTSFGGLPDAKVRRSMELFAREIVPAFRTGPAGAEGG